MFVVVLNDERLLQQRAEAAGGRGEQAITVALKATRLTVDPQRTLQRKLAVLSAVSFIFQQRQRWLSNQPVTGTEQLPEGILRHLFAMRIGLLLNVQAEILLQRTGQLQSVILFD